MLLTMLLVSTEVVLHVLRVSLCCVLVSLVLILDAPDRVGGVGGRVKVCINTMLPVPSVLVSTVLNIGNEGPPGFVLNVSSRSLVILVVPDCLGPLPALSNLAPSSRNWSRMCTLLVCLSLRPDGLCLFVLCRVVGRRMGRLLGRRGCTLRFRIF